MDRRDRRGGTLAVRPQDKGLDLLLRGAPLASGVLAEVAFRLAGRERRLTVASGAAYGVREDRITYSARDDVVALTWSVSGGDAARLTLAVDNVGKRSITIDRLLPFFLDFGEGGRLQLGVPKDWSVFQNGWTSWSPAYARRFGDGLFVHPATDAYRRQHDPFASAPDDLTSHGMAVLHDRVSALTLLLGFVSARNQLSAIRLVGGPKHPERLEAACYADGIPLAPGERLTSESLLVAAGNEPQRLLESYATILGDTMAARRPARIPTGWCSWYSFFESVEASEVRSNLEASQRGGLDLECFLVDDGHQESLGDWLETDRSRFPEGMAPLAEDIKESGGQAGIWVAPFGVAARSKLFEAHPGWVLRNEEDRPVVAWRHRRDTAFALDLTHPEVQAWLEETFRTLRDWGYTFFKADFLYAGALPGRRHDPRQTRAQALRRGLEVIREAIGDGFLLGCGAPLWPAVGLVDGMRIGPDVAAHWEPLWKDLAGPSAANAVRNTVARSFMHRRLWLNDPDCVLLRPRNHDSSLVLNETRTLATVIGLSGGLTFSGDDLSTLSRARLKYLERMLPPYGEAATAADLFSRELPGLLVLPIVRPHGRWVLAAAINWGDRTVTTTLDLVRLGLDPRGLYHAYDYWRGRYLGQVQGTLELGRHQPHETALLLFREVTDRPQLLTSTFHLTQGAVEITSVQREAADGRERLTVALARPGRQTGSLVFAVPEPFRPLGAAVEGRGRRLRPSGAGVFSLGLRVDGGAVVEVAFGKH